ncbi:MAG TPA: patatin-like phospholipase family protein [Anaerolineales bacterium]|nr:patatin-like phospholipase family protein [Anaerolineales bacterium]
MDISLALGGGGTRGNAHIGVIRRLEEEGYHIRALAGTSAGGLIAAFYAAGYTPDEIEEIFAGMDQNRLFGRSSADGPAILGLAGVSRLLEQYLGDRTFADLKLPCVVTAVDIQTASEVVIAEGRVMDAVLATIALPALLPPQRIGDLQLVDGARMDPVPVTPARTLMPKLPVVAVVLTPPLGQLNGTAPFQFPGKIPSMVMNGLKKLRLAQALDVYIHSADATDRMLTELRLRLDNPEVIIRPEVSHIQLLDKVDVRQVVRLGERATMAVLPQLRRAVSWPVQFWRNLFPRRLSAAFH